MPICAKCKVMLPPNFMTPVSKDAYLCEFCKRNLIILKYGEFNEKSVSKTELIKEYDIFMKMVKEKNSILKDAMAGDVKDIPEKLLI